MSRLTHRGHFNAPPEVSYFDAHNQA